MRVVIAADGLTAEVTAARGAPCSEAELHHELATAGVCFGLDQVAIAEFANRMLEPEWAGSAIVARGRHAEPGRDGRLLLTPAPGLQAGHEHRDGHIDYRERQFLVPIQSGAWVGTVQTATAGVDGRSVLDRPVPAKPGTALKLRIGPGLRQDDDRLQALRGGVLSWTPPVVDVVPLYTHGGDIDYHTGNLHTDGSLELRGDVREGFAATATHDVRIAGAVLNGTAVAGGSLVVDQGVLGGDARAEARGDIHCRHATAATLIAGGTVTFGDEATHCRLRATSLVAMTGRGTVFGGELRVRQTITVRTAGTGQGAPTLLLVGDVSDAEADSVRNGNADRKLAERMLQRGRQDTGRAGKATREAVRLGDPAQQERIRLRLMQRELLRTATVDIHETLHAGARVQFGERTFTSDEPRHHLRLRWDEAKDDIVEEPLP